MRIVLTLTLGALICQPLTSVADPCQEVVGDTVAELRAGADGWWSEDIEGLVRAAAGSACIKAQSKRYQAANVSPPVVEMEATSMRENARASAQENAQENAQDSSPENAEDDDDGSWNFGGLTIRSMSGSPSQKPYERARQTKQTDKDKRDES